jgi:hypothetical protein
VVLLFQWAAAQHMHHPDSKVLKGTQVKDDTARLDFLLNAAMIQIKTPGELTADLDSADVFIDQAVKINGFMSFPLPELHG